MILDFKAAQTSVPKPFSQMFWCLCAQCGRAVVEEWREKRWCHRGSWGTPNRSQKNVPFHLSPPRQGRNRFPKNSHFSTMISSHAEAPTARTENVSIDMNKRNQFENMGTHRPGDVTRLKDNVRSRNIERKRRWINSTAKKCQTNTRIQGQIWRLVEVTASLTFITITNPNQK